MARLYMLKMCTFLFFNYTVINYFLKKKQVDGIQGEGKWKDMDDKIWILFPW